MKKALNSEELIVFCSQLSMILHAGISVIEGIAVMKEDLPEGEGRAILETLYEDMEQTGSLADAMRKSAVFPDYVCSMTAIGEQTGRLDEVMDGLAFHYEREKNLRETIKSALTYPAIMLGMLTVVILILIVQVMPIFQNVLQQLGGGLTGISAGLLRLGMLFGRYSIVFVILLAVLAAGIGYLGVTKRGRERFRRWLESSSVTGKLSGQIACARLAQGLHLCISSGLDLEQGLEMAAQLLSHKGMKEKISHCRELLWQGERLDQALTQSRIFSGLYGKMISVGMRTGAMDQVMKKIADGYEEEVTESLQKKTALVEPTLVAVLSVLVGLILISVMLPLMSVMSSIG